MWCSVCGWNFDEGFEKGYEYGEGDICECCGTEFGCDEDMYKEDVLQEYCNNDINILKKIAPEIALMNDDDVIPYEVARKFLRLKWIKNGAKYKYFKGKEWNLENMKKQLERLHYKYEALLPLAELISDGTEPPEK